MDARSDLFSLGAVLYEMVTGERAFAGASAGAVFDRILNREPRRASRVNPRVPEPLEAVLDRLLAKQPENRYPSASELQSDLDQVARVLAAEEVGLRGRGDRERSGRRGPRRAAGVGGGGARGAAGARRGRLRLS